MYEIISTLEKWPGRIELPDLDEFNRVQFRDYSDITEKFAKEYPKLPIKPHGIAFSAALFIAKHGTWDIDGLAIDEFLGWRDKPEDEKTKLVHWLAVKWSIYWARLTNPNA